MLDFYIEAKRLISVYFQRIATVVIASPVVEIVEKSERIYIWRVSLGSAGQGRPESDSASRRRRGVMEESAEGRLWDGKETIWSVLCVLCRTQLMIRGNDAKTRRKMTLKEEGPDLDGGSTAARR